ncbi:hypothetical protein MCOR02_010647 [Pyricularia oryzae]|nr:hypothetical protein MCOR02_010647 [Pyricularia oryzae]KAI6476932.1 hypothetical protein MCOR17_000827 [Pyricularia oryzae]KAI6504791.1 hypothetical protein MCOR13_004715 [Pyricularia oryzae]KAI6599808.1 hypothetical protein MCOR04_002372 [Pyricularia oryzae]
MGGSAFTGSPYLLRTPRMPPEVYRHMVTHCHTALSGLFRTVTAPVEAPAKDSFGDVDFLVAEPIDADVDGSSNISEPEEIKKPKTAGPPVIWTKIEHALGAVRLKYNGKDATANFALPWPQKYAGLKGSLVDRNSANDQQVKLDDDTPTHIGKNNLAVPDADITKVEEKLADDDQETDDYVQVDIRICTTVKQLLWAAFKHAHGDMWQLLGTIIRPLGLKADETALYLITPEIEPINKKRAMVFLSDDPGQVCDFLGLPHADGQWDKPFGSVDDMFAYASQCRFFWIWPQAASDNADTTPDPLSPTRTQTANDRRRIKTRPAYRTWVDDFVPRLRSQGQHAPPADLASFSKDALRDHVREECFRFFLASRALYASQLAAWTAERQELAVRSELIKAVASEEAVAAHPGYDPVHGSSRGVVLAALKKIVVEGDASYGGIVPSSPLRNPDGTWRMDEAASWLRENWAAVAEVAWATNRAKCAENMKAKMKRKAEEAEGKGGGHEVMVEAGNGVGVTRVAAAALLESSASPAKRPVPVAGGLPWDADGGGLVSGSGSKSPVTSCQQRLHDQHLDKKQAV